MRKVDRAAAAAGKTGDPCEAAKAAYAKNVHVQRVGYLLKAAEVMATAHPNLSRAYVQELKEISQKHVIRLDATIKRAICKGCNTMLLPAKTAVVRAECHGRRSRGEPGGNGELGDTASAEAARHELMEPGMPEVADETQYNWMSVTCCVCTRTRRMKLEHPEILHDMEVEQTGAQ